MIFQFIADHRHLFPVRLMCRVLGVSPSGFYAWRGRPPSQRTLANRQLLEHIKRLHAASHQTYGCLRLFWALRRLGIRCGKHRVARLMAQNGIRARSKRAYKVTTRASKMPIDMPNLLQRSFTAPKPNAVWATDITYVPTREGWLYLAVVLDLYARRAVGWAMGKRLTRHLALKALQMAIAHRQPGADLIHHSDRGSQYTSHDYLSLLKRHDMQVSMSRTGSCFDNAAVESFFATLKSEWTHHRHYRTRREAATDIFYYIEVFYNRQRLHSSLKYVSPLTYEKAYWQSLAFCSN